MKVLSKEQMKKVLGGNPPAPGSPGSCHVVNKFGSGSKCKESESMSKSDAIDGMNQLYQDIQANNGEGNWWGATGAGYCCDSCNTIPVCSAAA